MSSIEGLKTLTDWMVKEGIKDFYSSNKEYIETSLEKIEHNVVGNDTRLGLYKKRGEQACKAVFIPGRFQFVSNTTATPQCFENGGVIIQQGDDIRGVQPDIFVATYRNINGTKITTADLPSIDPADLQVSQ